MNNKLLEGLEEALAHSRGDASAGVERVVLVPSGPRPISDPFPFRNHRTVAEVWGLATGGNAS